MATTAPLVVVLAGPNGAGKSTSAARVLRGALAVEEFVNADTIAKGLSAYRPGSAAVAAGRILLERLRFLARERRDFAFETTLAGPGVPESVVRRRFATGLANLFTVYLRVVDVWSIYDNADADGPRPIASGSRGKPLMITDAARWTRLREESER